MTMIARADGKRRRQRMRDEAARAGCPPSQGMATATEFAAMDLLLRTLL